MPIVTIGDNTGDDYVGTEDTHIRNTAPLNNFGTAHFNLRNSTDQGQLWAGLMSFSGLSNIPPSSVINGTSLWGYNRVTQGTPKQASLRRCLRPWVESQATGNEYATGLSWGSLCAQTDGVDRSPTITSIINFAGGIDVYKVTSSAQLDADISAFVAGVQPNYGWVFDLDPGLGDDIHSFVASEGVDGQRPFLLVNFDAATGSPRGGSLSLLGVGS